MSQQPHSHEIWESPQAEGIRAGHGGAHINSSKPLSSAQSRRQRKVLLRQLILSRQAGLQQGEIQRTPLSVLLMTGSRQRHRGIPIPRCTGGGCHLLLMARPCPTWAVSPRRRQCSSTIIRETITFNQHCSGPHKDVYFWVPGGKAGEG